MTDPLSETIERVHAAQKSWKDHSKNEGYGANCIDSLDPDGNAIEVSN